MEQLFLFQKNVMKLQLQMERCFSELAGDPACNPMRSRLQPDAIQPATRCHPACNPTRSRLQPELAGSTGRPTIVIFDRGVLDSRAFIPEHLWARGVAALNRELTGCTADGSKRPEGSISNEYLLKRYDADLTQPLP